jgi:hypothetical protein
VYHRWPGHYQDAPTGFFRQPDFGSDFADDSAFRLLTRNVARHELEDAFALDRTLDRHHANAFVADGDQIWLRVARIGAACAFHASTNGQTWQMIRHFALDAPATISAGFVAQSPTASGCTATFNEICFVAGRLRDIRDGT